MDALYTGNAATGYGRWLRPLFWVVLGTLPGGEAFLPEGRAVGVHEGKREKQEGKAAGVLPHCPKEERMLDRDDLSRHAVKRGAAASAREPKDHFSIIAVIMLDGC
ncbi:hypothetical protein HPB50_002258 [Hyalomma asiaticum]|uniref:Uncharacterized protein n=1 Tax=Hyalomma asiaticum TaxID=266040 RepID=A0ACB7TAN6_HYAAI|nr:hypothetical protein HPB50_002258 [Hyalomma asiaticum]